MLNIYTLPRVPGATNTTEWTTFCHQRTDFVVISHETSRPTSRWTGVDRVRKFRVTLYGHNKRFGSLFSSMESFHTTLALAEKQARKIATEFAAKKGVA